MLPLFATFSISTLQLLKFTKNKLVKITAIKTVKVPHQVNVRAKVMVFTLTLSCLLHINKTLSPVSV